MAVYLGSGDKLKINLNNVAYCLNLFADPPITNGIRLISSDGHIVKDSRGLYVTATKESE